eukprot:GDKI01025942.1.p1 GENE.GDKI01025942.1~~GDKI01025942.1.p1  ORF type:complete len:525 (-),score=128.42 GDKI01025942.1:351-1925(-)
MENNNPTSQTEPLTAANNTANNTAKSNVYVQKLVGTAVLGSFLFGYNIAVLNTAMPLIVQSMEWCGDGMRIDCDAARTNKAVINTAVFLGAAIGCLLAGRLLPFGRRKVLLFNTILFLIGTLLACVSWNFTGLLCGRLVTGLAVGVVTVAVPAYISEVAPEDQKGFYGVMHQLTLTIGILLAIALGLPLTTPDPTHPQKTDTFSAIWWRVMIGLGCIPAVLQSVFFACVYTTETPLWLIEQNRSTEAEGVLQKIYNGNGSSIGRNGNGNEASVRLAELQQAVDAAKQQQSKQMTLVQALRQGGAYRHAILVGTVLSMFQQFSGINVVMSRSNNIFESAGVTGRNATYASTGMALLNVLTTVVASWVIEAWGRRKLMLVGSLGQTLALLPAAIGFCLASDADTHTLMPPIAVTSLLLFVVFFAVAYGPVLWVYLAEIYPTEIKSSAASFASAMNWVATLLMVFSSEYMGTTATFVTFAMTSALSFLLIFSFMLESKGTPAGKSVYFLSVTEQSTPTPASVSLTTV